MGVKPRNKRYCLNLDAQCLWERQIWANASSSSLPLTLTVLYSSSANPPPPSSYKLPHPCGMHARAIRFSFSLAPLISLCSRMWAESCIPNTKNNHFGGSGGGWKGCVSVQMSRGGGVGENSQLTGIRLNCSYSRRGARTAIQGAIYFLQSLARKCQVPAPVNVESRSFFHAFNPGLVQSS